MSVEQFRLYTPMEAIFLIFGLSRLTLAGFSEPEVFRGGEPVPSYEREHCQHFGGRGFSDGFAPNVISLSFEENSTCKLHSDIVREEAKKLNIWALRMIDATARIPSGILSGNLNQYGDFDECVTSKFKFENQNVKGKYCLATINISFENVKINKNLSVIDSLIHSHRIFKNEMQDAGHRIPKLETFNWGICVPHSCTRDELQSALKRNINTLSYSREIRMDFLIDENMCFEEGQREFTVANAASVLFFTFIILLCFYATATDSSGPDSRRRKFVQYLRCFSLKKNFSALTKTDHAPDEISVLHGARFLNAIALLLSHKQMAMMFIPFVNRTQMAEVLGRPWSMIGRSAILYTDTFVFISGLLLSYSLVKELDEKKKINFRGKLVSRLIRFLPSLFSLVIFCTYILEHLGSGPQWGLVVKQYADLCKRHMWKNFLFVHNYFGFENMCLTHTHQLGLDMQLFLVSPVITYILWKKPKRGLLVLLVLGIMSTCLRYYITLRENLSTLIHFGISVERLWKTANLSYILPTHRLTVYGIGLTLGYFLRRKGKNLTFSYNLKWMGWIVAVSAGLIAMFGPYHASKINYQYNSNDAASYNAFSPILWVLFLSWCVIACENGWGGPFHDFLSWKYFRFFTKISYSIYLTQFPVFFYGVGTRRTSKYYKGFHSLIDIPEFVMIFALSVAMTLLFELPFQNLRRTYLENCSQPRGEEYSSRKKLLPNVLSMESEYRKFENHGE